MKSLLLTVILLISPIGLMMVSAKADYTLYSYDLSTTTADGSIDPSEYATYFDLSVGGPAKSITVYWGHNESHFAVGIEGEFGGWVGFGMNTGGNGMTGADMIISSVDNDGVHTGDYHATGHSEPSIDDDQMPISIGGKESNGKTTIEFIIPMSSSDTAGNDHNWVNGGSYNFFLAYHESSDSLTYHSGHSEVHSVDVAGPSVALPENRNISGGVSGSESGALFGALLVIGFIGFIVILVKYNAKLT